MENNRGNIKLFDLLRTLSLIVLIIFGFVTIIASGGDDDDEDEPEDVVEYSVSGTITLASDSTSLANITVDLSGDATRITTTDDDGNYSFSVENGDYTITPNTATGYEFDPVSIDVTINDADVTGQDFAGTQISAAKFLHYTLIDQYSFYQEYIVDDQEPNEDDYDLDEDGELNEDEEAAYLADWEPWANRISAAEEEEGLLSAYTVSDGVEYGGGTISGYALDQFIDKDVVNAATPDPEGLLGTLDARELYTVVARSNQDGFSIRTMFVNKGYYDDTLSDDLRWDEFKTGYLLDLYYTGKIYFPSDDIVKRQHIKYAYDVYMFRKIDVLRPDEEGTLVTFEVQATTDNYVDDTQFIAVTEGAEAPRTTTKFTVETVSFGDYAEINVISMDQFITEYVTDNPESYTYKIVALDDTYEDGLTYANLEDAYYLVDFDLIVRLDTSGEEIDGSKINFPSRIEVVSDSTVEYDYTAADPPAYAFAYEE